MPSRKVSSSEEELSRGVGIAMATIDDIDLTDLDVFVERMPHDSFDLLRR